MTVSTTGNEEREDEVTASTIGEEVEATASATDNDNSEEVVLTILTTGDEEEEAIVSPTAFEDSDIKDRDADAGDVPCL